MRSVPQEQDNQGDYHSGGGEDPDQPYIDMPIIMFPFVPIMPAHRPPV